MSNEIDTNENKYYDEEQPKITNWKNEPTIKDLKENIDDAENDQEQHHSNVKRWLSNRNIKKPKKQNRSSIAPKVIRKQNEWRYASLSDPFLSTPDIYNVRPVTAGDKKRAKQNELILNNQFNTKIQKVKFIDDYVREAVDVGTVIVKVGWDSESEEVTKTVPIYEYKIDTSGELAQYYMQLIQLRVQDAEAYADHSTPSLDHALEMFKQNGVAHFVREVGTKEVTEIVETKNQPTVEIPNSENIIIDPSCDGDLEKASFIGEKFKASIASLEKDGKYTNLDKINVESNSILANPDYEENNDVSSFTFKDKPRKKFLVYTYWGEWDIHGDGKTVHQIVCSWVGDTIIRMELNPFPDRKPPFVKAVYMPVRESVFGEPDAELLEDNQEIIGAVTRGSIDLLGRSANSQMGIRKDLLDVTNQRRFRKGLDYEFNGSVDPRQAIYQHTYPEIPQSAFNMINLQNAEAESLTGVKAYNSGIGSQALGDTATGIRGALDAASKRELGILRRLAKGIIDIGRKIIAMNAEFLSEEEVVRVTDEQFIQVRRDDLAGNYDLQLSISTAEEDNNKAQELAFMLQTAGPNMDPDLGKIIWGEIARLRKMPYLAEKIENYQPEPDPVQQQRVQLEMRLLAAQIQKEQALAAKHNTEAGANQQRGAKDGSQAALNMAKAEESQAKARNLGSEADQKDLDYLETESGVKHQRELDKINTKSRNDMINNSLNNIQTSQE